MKNDRSRSKGHAQQGGITILTVLMLLVLVTVVAFSMARLTVRELSVSGTTWQGAKASEAAEAGLDWFVLWTQVENRAQATDRRRDDLVEAMDRLTAPNTWSNPAINTYLLDPLRTWDRAITVTSTETEADSDMVFQNSGAGFRQSSATTGNAVVQSFDIVCRFLGTGMVDTISSDSGKPAGDTTPSKGTQFFVFQLQSTGKASVPIGAGYMRYFANRELYLNTVP